MSISKKRVKHADGFTIVELLIVVVVIAILAAISTVAYAGIQNRAHDSKMALAANQVEKALKLYAVDNGTVVRGGWGSTTAATGNGCSDGADGFFGSSTYTCAAEDTLVAHKLLPAGFTMTLPSNPYFATEHGGRYSFMLYSCGAGRYGLYWSLRQPTSADTASLDNAFAACGHGSQLRDDWGMRAGRVVQL